MKARLQEPAKNSTPADNEAPRLFRVVVGSASEAVELIQQRFGSGATVQSVKQQQPKGVSKLWTSPKLEIVVSVPAHPSLKAKFQLESETPKSATPKTPETLASETRSDEAAMPSIEEVARSSRAETPFEKPAELPAQRPGMAALSVEDLLIQSEFDPTLIQRLKTLPQWNALSGRSLQHALSDVISLLREDFIAAQKEGPGGFTAFIGSPGVGKTSMLRKYVANRVFIHGKKVQILKLDDEDPNPDDLLNVFCDIIATPLVRDPNDLRLEKGTELYVDLPGIPRHQPERIRHFRAVLDELNVRSRVWVMNSLYDTRTLANTYEVAKRLGATHQTFTHLDELENWVKLWKFVLKGSLPLIFLNMGNESSAAPKDEFLPLLISRTFPKILLN
jgi:flagellar biosynthesis protein FlhF